MLDQPLYDYCVPAWSPYLLKDIDLLEQMQCRATKLEEQFATLGLHFLFCRRQRGDLIEMFKN